MSWTVKNKDDVCYGKEVVSQLYKALESTSSIVNNSGKCIILGWSAAQIYQNGTWVPKV